MTLAACLERQLDSLDLVKQALDGPNAGLNLISCVQSFFASGQSEHPHANDIASRIEIWTGYLRLMES